MPSSAGGQRLITRLVAGAVLLSGLIGCGSDTPQGAAIGEVCGLEQACVQGALCVDGICRQVCNAPADCPPGIGCREGSCRSCLDGSHCAAAWGCDQDSGLCNTHCRSDGDCKEPGFCDATGGLCLFDLADGGPCDRVHQCANGHCTDGVCCDQTCAGECQACLASHTGGLDGQCLPVTMGLDPAAECVGTLACDGAGACFDKVLGDACGDDYECLSGTCMDGVCCDAPCGVYCFRCDQAGHRGECLIDQVLCPELPHVAAIDGTGPTEAIAPRPADLIIWNLHASERVAASRRISPISQELELMLGGANSLLEVYADRDGTNGHIAFSIEDTTTVVGPGGKTMLSVRIRFGAQSGAISTGLFILTLVADSGTSQAQVFFLQGQDGDDHFTCVGDVCTTDKKIVVNDTIEVQSLVVRTAPACPPGYSRDVSEPQYVVCKRGLDEMVKVGDFWVDRYEAIVVDEGYWAMGGCNGIGNEYSNGIGETPDSLSDLDFWLNLGFPINGQWIEPLYACSVHGVMPSHFVTWFQAGQACALAGKYLVTNSEWQIAAAGTDDHTDGIGYCNIVNSETVENGSRSNCISNWGAYDLVGNLWEWVDLWQGHPGFNGDLENRLTSTESAADFGRDQYFSGGPRKESMPSRRADGSWRATGFAWTGKGETQGQPYGPAASLRGGSFKEGDGAGVFSLHLAGSPSDDHLTVGFRCAMR